MELKSVLNATVFLLGFSFVRRGRDALALKSREVILLISSEISPRWRVRQKKKNKWTVWAFFPPWPQQLFFYFTIDETLRWRGRKQIKRRTVIPEPEPVYSIGEKDLRHSLAGGHIYSKLSSVLPNRKNKGRSVVLLGLCVPNVVGRRNVAPHATDPFLSQLSLLNDSQNMVNKSIKGRQAAYRSQSFSLNFKQPCMLLTKTATTRVV